MNYSLCETLRHGCLLLLISLLATQELSAQDLEIDHFGGEEVVSGSIVVQFDPTVSGVLGKTSAVEAQLARVRSQAAGDVATVSERIGIEQWEVRGDIGVTLQQLNTLPGVRAVPNYVVRMDWPEAVPVDISTVEPLQNDSFPDDPFFDEMWGLYNDGSFIPGYSVDGAHISAPSAWSLTTGSEDVVAVIFDSGFDVNHPDLADNVWQNPGEVPLNGIDDDGNGYVDDVHGWYAYNGTAAIQAGAHGTHVAGTVGAVGNNAEGVTGVNWNVQLISVGIFNPDGVTTIGAILAGYEYITALLEQGVPVTVVNQSWGGSAPFDNPFVQQFVGMYRDFALQHDAYGALWVCSAGNDAVDNDEVNVFRYPSSLQAPNIISVGSTDSGENPSSFSNIGLYTVDVGAPGTDVLSTVPDGNYAFFSGTSMASPHVAGAVALLRALDPNASHRSLVARILAGADRLPQYEPQWSTGARLNAYHAMAPSAIPAVLQTGGLVPSASAGYVFKSFGDLGGISTLGFANATGGSVDVTGVAIAGPDQDAFSLYPGDTLAATVPAEGGYGVAYTFEPTEEGRREYEATMTISTSAGDVAFDLYGLDQPIAVVRVEPDAAELGLVPRGSEIQSAFTIFNDGDDALQYEILQTLVAEDEAETEELARLTSFVPERSVPGKSLVDRRGYEASAISAALAGMERPTIEVRPDRALTRAHRDALDYSTDPNLMLLYAEDFEDTTAVLSQWTVLDVGDGNAFELYDLIEAEDTTDFVFLAGDLDEGYQNNTLTAAASPFFDFSALAELGYGPYFLVFDYAAELEAGFDAFYINAIVGGENFGTIADTEGSLTADGSVRQAVVDITPLVGAGLTSFYFILSTDGSVVGGFGALFDNVQLIIGDAPYFASSTRGEIAPGGSEDITATVRTGLIPEGDYTLFSQVFSDAVNNAGLAGHEFSFRSEDFNVVFDPDTSVIEEELYRDSTTTTAFTATNIAPDALPFEAFTGLMRLDEAGPDTMMEAVLLARSLQAETERGSPLTVSGPLRPRPLVNAMLSGQGLRERLDTPLTMASRVVASQQAAGTSLLTESFDTSTAFPDDWTMVDYTSGTGGVWEVTPITEGENVVLFGDLATGTYANNSATEVFSPILDFTSVTPDSALFLEFDYASLMETGFDFFVVYANILDENDAVTAFEVLASSEDVLVNDGTLNTAMFDVTFLRGQRVAFSFYVETDVAVNAGLAMFDDIMVYTDVLPVWVEPTAGTIPAEGSQEFTVGINASDLAPGSYAGFTVIASLFDGGAGDEVTQDVHYTLFDVINRVPSAVSDTIAVVAGDAVPFSDILDVVLANDTDGDEDALVLYDYTEPLFGDLKRTGFGTDASAYSYVAPLHYEGLDSMMYTATDGFDASEAATVIIEVYADPSFQSGLQQNYTLLEDDSLTLNTMLMAAGVGGLDAEVLVWAGTDDEGLAAMHDGAAHTLMFIPAPDNYGQFDVTLYVGHEGQPSDSAGVTVVVAPVNDAPTATFEYTVDGAEVAFISTASDSLDPEGAIVAYQWSFDDGTGSEEADPTHAYASSGEYDVTLTVTDNAGASASVTQTVNVPTGTDVASEEVPTEFVLRQNYPNPFNPSTTIRFGLPEAQSVTVRVYNALGQVVHTFYDGTTLAAGYHDLNIDAGRLASGIYLYQLEAVGQDGARTLLPAKKMVLLK